MSTSTPNKEELYRLGVQTAKSGQKQSARVMFEQVLAQDQRNVRSMMWLAKLASTPQERAQWLERVLAVNPKNETAKKQLAKLNNRDQAARNKILLRVGVVVYVIVIALIAFGIILTAA